MSDDSMYKNEHKPTHGEFLAIGVCGILLFSTTILYALYTYYRRPMTQDSKYFYLSMILMGVNELPRYFGMAATDAYNSTVCYGFHCLGDFFYFVCLAIVALTFAHILELGPYVALLYSKKGIMIAVCCQGVIDVAMCIGSWATASLAIIFHSRFYLAFTIFDIGQNFLYSSVLAFYGIRLITSYRNYAKHASTPQQREVFRAMLMKVSSILAVISVFSLLRMTLLVIKLTSLVNNGVDVTTATFTLYGFVWFLMSDFLPRGCSVLLLAVLMQVNVIKTAATNEVNARESNKQQDDGNSSSNKSIEMADRDDYGPEDDNLEGGRNSYDDLDADATVTNPAHL